MSRMRNTDELVEKHLKTIRIPQGFENCTKDLVRKMIDHPAFNNTEYVRLLLSGNHY